MDFDKYSKEKFASLGLNTPAGRTLANELQADVNKVIQPTVVPAFVEVIEQLNARGHNLKLSGDTSAGKHSFSDEPIKDQCCLRLGCDVVVNAGYGHELKPSKEILDSVSKKLQETWDRYIDAVHRFIALNISVIAGVAAVVSFVPTLHKVPAPQNVATLQNVATPQSVPVLQNPTEAPVIITSKQALSWGLVFLLVCLLSLVIVRIWVQQFMDYEVMQPREDVEKYFQGRIHYSQSYRLEEWSYRWQYFTVRVITVFAPLSFLAGLSLSLLFVYKNLP